MTSAPPGFTPPCCPYDDCLFHKAPPVRFFNRHGTYSSMVKSEPIHRFRCKECERTFSTQTFRVDYRDRQPWKNQPVLQLILSGVSLRQAGRVVRMTFNNLEKKARKLARHAGLLDDNLQDAHARSGGQLNCKVTGPRFQFDEFETYEACRYSRPVTVPVLIERDSRFHVGAVAGSIRPRGKMTERRLEKVAEDEARFGFRRNESIEACRSVLERGARLARGHGSITIESDKKTTYPRLAREAFEGMAIVHRRVDSKAPRGRGTMLFAINHTEMIYRDHLARLIRDSWCVSKKRGFLTLFLRAYQSLRNWVAPRFNGETATPAQRLGLATRPLRLVEFMAWRQDFGRRSVDPFRPSRAVGC